MTFDQFISPNTSWSWATPPTGSMEKQILNQPGTGASTMQSLDSLQPWSKKDFGSYKESEEIKVEKLKRKFSLAIPSAIVWISIATIIGIVFILIAKINIWSSNHDVNYSSTVQSYKDLIINIDNMVGYPGIGQYQTLLQSINDNNIQQTINSSIPFIFKQDILNQTVGTLITTILAKSQTLQEITKDITKYGFIHPTIMGLLEKNKDQIPIMVSLHTLETIKFGTALKIFSMLDTFLQQASQSLWIPKDQLAKLMEQYTQRGETDIANYLSMCYLNPYERLPNCDQINDFSNYFLYEDKNNTIDTNLFGKLFSLIDTKLEKSDVASLQIDFNRFDPNAKNIGFRVTVNTLSEDDAAFMARWILNPHIFIISTLVSLLKQSYFVIGDSINIDKLNIKQQNITVGNIQIPVNTSFMTFDLPLQNSSEREIFDFYNTNK